MVLITLAGGDQGQPWGSYLQVTTGRLGGLEGPFCKHSGTKATLRWKTASYSQLGVYGFSYELIVLGPAPPPRCCPSGLKDSTPCRAGSEEEEGRSPTGTPCIIKDTT